MKREKPLSLAQKKALCGLPINRTFIPAHTGFQWPTIAILKARGYVNPIKSDIAGYGPEAECIVTAKGLRRREEIESKRST
jgi:hypothetical protein